MQPIKESFCEAVARRVYPLKIYKDGELIRDLVPCVRESDNKIGLYDKVSDKFFEGV